MMTLFLPCLHVKNGDGVPCKIQLECPQTPWMVNVINKLWQLNVCSKTYCITTIQWLNRESGNWCTDWSTQFINTNNGKYHTVKFRK